MSRFTIANFLISAYNMLWVLVIFFCMATGIRPPSSLAYLFVPWAAVGVALYTAVVLCADR